MKKQCPYCKEMIDENLTVCPFCCEDLPIINKPSFIICPYCNEKIKSDLNICPICCEEIPQKQEPEKPKTKICPYCKEEIDFDLNICPVCCEKLTQTIDNNNSINTEKYEVNPKNTKKTSLKSFIWIPKIFLAIIILFILWWLISFFLGLLGFDFSRIYSQHKQNQKEKLLSKQLGVSNDCISIWIIVQEDINQKKVII